MQLSSTLNLFLDEEAQAQVNGCMNATSVIVCATACVIACLYGNTVADEVPRGEMLSLN